MIILSKVKQATKEFIKVLRYGNIDVLTPIPILPYGIDSKPVKNSVGAFSKTANDNTSVLLGYTLKSEKTNEGETRIYATDTSGNEVFDIYLKNDGTCEFGGNTDFFTKYNALNSGMQTFVNALNAQLTTALALVPFTWVPVTINISAAKTNNIKTG